MFPLQIFPVSCGRGALTRCCAPEDGVRFNMSCALKLGWSTITSRWFPILTFFFIFFIIFVLRCVLPYPNRLLGGAMFLCFARLGKNHPTCAHPLLRLELFFPCLLCLDNRLALFPYFIRLILRYTSIFTCSLSL